MLWLFCLKPKCHKSCFPCRCLSWLLIKYQFSLEIAVSMKDKVRMTRNMLQYWQNQETTVQTECLLLPKKRLFFFFFPGKELLFFVFVDFPWFCFFTKNSFSLRFFAVLGPGYSVLAQRAVALWHTGVFIYAYQFLKQWSSSGWPFIIAEATLKYGSWGMWQ